MKNRILTIFITTTLVSSALLAETKPVSPSQIVLPKIPEVALIIEIPEKTEAIKETKPGTVGEEDTHWGEKRVEYFGGLEIDEKNGLRYIESLESDKLENRNYYQHTYFGKMLTEIDFRNKKGELSIDEINDAAIIKQRYDKEGNLVEESSYNTDGMLKKDWYGFAIYRWEYDSKHTRIKGAFYDENGRLAKKRFCDTAINTWNYDDKGNVAVWANYDPNGILSKDILGIAAIRYEYDEFNREILSATYGTDRKLMNNKYGVSVTFHFYDDKNNSLIITRCDNDLKPVNIEGGYFIRTIKDSEGIWTETALYDAKGILQENQDGEAIVIRLRNGDKKSTRRLIYDKQKNLTGEWELDAEKGKWLPVEPENK